jgi:hypothetical protein
MKSGLKGQYPLALALASIGSAILVLTSAPPASANKFSSTVTVSGSTQQAWYSINQCMVSLTFTNEKGQVISAPLGGGCGKRSYWITFTSVPLNGFLTNWVLKYSGGTEKGSFIVNRPYVGSTLARNIY